MKEPLVLYSTNTWLAYAISERYYGGVHYAWCSPVYDGRRTASHVNIPPTSSPAEIYRLLSAEVDRGERHSVVLEKNRKGLGKGLKARQAEGLVSATQQEEVASTIDSADIRDFRPVLYVIPFERVRGLVVDVPVPERAHPMSIEYRVERLSRDCFDMLELGA
jgi:hypothetical protein